MDLVYAGSQYDAGSVNVMSVAGASIFSLLKFNS